MIRGKIKGNDYNRLRFPVEDLLRKNPGAMDRYREAGLSPQRFRCDALRAAAHFVDTHEPLYAAGFTDAHIDTAMRGIMADLGLDWAAQKVGTSFKRKAVSA